jgi:phosphate transport system substrate-binding protein
MRNLITALVFTLSLTASGADTVVINGAGATFPYPLYSKWFSEFKKINPSAEINYQSIGSGGGIRQLLDKTVDFGASDAPMTNEQLAQSTTPVLNLPTVLGAVCVTYQLPGMKDELQLDAKTLADIFLGNITKWDDAALKKLNPKAALPSQAIVVVHRADGSGTTSVFTDYLAKVSPDWKAKVGAGTAVKWPVGLGGKGNEGVTGLLKQTPGSIGYLEMTYAETNHLPVTKLQNKSGEFVLPSTKSVTLAAKSAQKNIPADFRVSITDAPGKGVYPISSFTYLLFYRKMEAKKGQTLIKFMEWALGAGQKMAEPLSYAPLPSDLVVKVKKALTQIDTK